MRVPTAARTRRTLTLLPALALALLMAGVAAQRADAAVTGYAEPTYTKTSGNNSFWWNWVAVDGLDESNRDRYEYYLCLSTFRAGNQVEFSNGTNGPGSTNCTGSLRNGPTPRSGDFGALPFTPQTVLDDGVVYSMCASGWYRWPHIWRSDSATTNNCPGTRIDRNKPQITVFVNGTQEFTNNPVLQLRTDYEDAVSPPWFGSNGRASNWICIARGGPCTPAGQPNDHCSNPVDRNSRITQFHCTADATNDVDGVYHFCVRSADAAVPDNPSGPNQFLHANSNNANISDVRCGHVTLDRQAPQVTASASATTVNVGDLVNLSASATDSSSGVTGQFTWNYGDNTQQGSGATTTHTYTQPGTYVARATTADRAGNGGNGTVTITVNPAPGNGGGGTPPPGGGGGGTPPPDGGSPPPDGGSGGGTPPPDGGQTPATPGTVGAVQQPITPRDVSNGAGGGGSQTTDLGRLDVVAPKRVNLRKTRRLLLALTAETGGRVDVALLRGSRIVSRKGATLGGPGTYAMTVRLSRRLASGRYSLKVSYTPAGSTRAATRTLRLRITGGRKARRSVVAGASSRGLEGTRGGVLTERPASTRGRAIALG